jgi:hypothetical protein
LAIVSLPVVSEDNELAARRFHRPGNDPLEAHDRQQIVRDQERRIGMAAEARCLHPPIGSLG